MSIYILVLVSRPVLDIDVPHDHHVVILVHVHDDHVHLLDIVVVEDIVVAHLHTVDADVLVLVKEEEVAVLQEEDVIVIEKTAESKFLFYLFSYLFIIVQLLKI